LGRIPLYEAYPEVPVVIDGQVDFYGEALLRDDDAIRHLGAGWREMLDRYDVRWTLTSSDAPVNAALAADPAWRLVHRDGVSTVYARKAAAEQPDVAEVPR
jgi:hypothetical protein